LKRKRQKRELAKRGRLVPNIKIFKEDRLLFLRLPGDVTEREEATGGKEKEDLRNSLKRKGGKQLSGEGKVARLQVAHRLSMNSPE